MLFSRILIANRGEIACRIIRTARRLGIETVAVHSSADAQARHVRLADQSVAIGGPAARDSYLLGERIVAAALATGARAVHPGYGFLSENEGFAQACAEAGLVFIGPPVAAIRAMGGKSAAKRLMEQAGVPLTPGYHGDDQDPDTLFRQASAIGWPVLIKASAGGGGKGMRLVERADDFAAALQSCQREAQASFGDATMLVEKYITRPRHIEVQVFGDTQGDVVYLFERDCSVQRRHQKVLEEAPAPGMTAARRRAMGEAAVKAAKAVAYVGAGTVEFIANQDGSFYFMEMNTRLQVEHPVTEMITGLDLVEWQLRVAAGEPLPRSQAELTITGHALEARIYAEDPQRGFLPSTGRLAWLRTPAESDNVRIDSGVEAGDPITPFYDPMIAKLIVHGTDRDEALQRMSRALREFEVLGVANNVAFLDRLIRSDSFRLANLDTGLIEREREVLFPAEMPAGEDMLVLAALHGALSERERIDEAPVGQPDDADTGSPWRRCADWRLAGPAGRTMSFIDGQTLVAVHVQPHPMDFIPPTARHSAGAGTALRFTLTIGERRIEAAVTRLAPNRIRATIGEWTVPATVIVEQGFLWVFADGRRLRLGIHDPLADIGSVDSSAGGLSAPMPGRIIALRVAAGDSVAKGQALLIMEAMKMEHTIAAPADGVVQALPFGEGEQVDEGAVLVVFVESKQETAP